MGITAALFVAIFFIFCLTGYAVLLTSLAKNLAYRVAVFVLSIAVLVLTLRCMQDTSEENDIIEKKATLYIKYKDGTILDTVYNWKRENESMDK